MHGGAHQLHGLLHGLGGAFAAGGQHFVHEAGLGEDGGAAFVQGLEEGLQVLQEHLLAVHAAHGGAGAAFAHFGLHFGAGEELVIGEEVAHVGIARIALAEAGRVGEHGLHLGGEVVERILKEDAVAVALGHLLPVSSGNDSHLIGDISLRDLEYFAVLVVELDGGGHFFEQQMDYSQLYLINL